VFLSPVTSSAESSPVSFNRVFALDTIPPEPLEFLVPERLEYDLILNYIEYPLFPGCVDFKKDKEKLACSHLRLDNFVYSNLKYPRKAKRKSIEGQVVVEFMVDIDGSIKDAEIIREIGGGCDEEAIRIVENMNNLPVKWIPGKINGTPKKMKCKLFIDFKYKGKKRKKEDHQKIA
jgi:protein TonB